MSRNRVALLFEDVSLHKRARNAFPRVRPSTQHRGNYVRSVDLNQLSLIIFKDKKFVRSRLDFVSEIQATQSCGNCVSEIRHRSMP